jgi:hypothetical protein
MFSTLKQASALLLCLIMAACTSSGSQLAKLGESRQAKTAGTTEGWIEKNRWVAVGPFVTVNNDCSMSSRARVRILEQPTNGRAVVIMKRGEVGFKPDHRLANCNDKPIVGPMVQYTPKKGFIGTDRYVFEVLFKDGERRILPYVVTMRDTTSR